ncbi:hypothetical protein [Nannocystis pusilla]|uniref:DUF1328 domain-containing protein n=1 Tax=Nannocystis pusilla TaxID=889268 RepID=A0ABS7TX84_9BACT|nr:hypothetical protein [Nannocystis pusilla]MBZ5712819.1 hypothetical protein [Nannocystis pusilla]
MSRWAVFFLFLFVIVVVYLVDVGRTAGADELASSWSFVLFLGVFSLLLLLVLVAGDRAPRKPRA